jgi:MinD-like ATPase involved in chromosome partitioning or flagellar assembly
VDGTETGWGRPAEPAPRWRALLDRARHASRPEEGHTQDERPEEPAPIRQAPASAAQPLPTRPSGALERRPGGPLEPRPASPLEPGPVSPLEPGPVSPLEPGPVGSLEPRPQRPPPFERRAANPLDRRAPINGLEPRPADPAPRNPLEARRRSRIAEGFLGRAEAEQGHSFFNPATRSVPPPITRLQGENGYPPARAAASVGSAAVLPPPVTVEPISPAGARPEPPGTRLAPPATRIEPAAARIEWRRATADEDLERAIAVLRRKLRTPRVLAFANPKGGVHKTTATVLAAATIGSVRGRGVLAWDDNELRGTLGLRAGSARHARTIRHLVSDLLQIENMHGDELLETLDDYLRHASDGSYDVLAGEENPRFAQRLDQHTVRRVMDLLRRTHDVICVDTGNNVESVNWQTVMRAADQLVITTVPREDAAFTADWMLDLLTDTGMADMVANAVTLISCPGPGPMPLLEDLTRHFSTRTRAVAVVPYDPALEVGSSIEYGDLQTETRHSWLRATSTMLEPFVD